MSDYGADDEDWFEDMWFADDVENLPDTLAPTAYAHSPPYAPDTYDFYDSDYDEYQTSGDDSYFDGSPAPSPPASPALSATTKIPHSVQLNKTQTHIHTPQAPPTSSPRSRFVDRLESRYKEAVQGKKFYGEGEVGDEKYLSVERRRRRRREGAREGGVRKRRKVEVAHPGTTTSTGGIVSVEVGVVEIGPRVGEGHEVGNEVGDKRGGEEERDDDGSASAEGYNSDRDSLEGQQQPPQQLPTTTTCTTTTARTMKKAQVVIRPPVLAAAIVAKPSRSTPTSISTTVGGGGDGGGGIQGRGKVTGDNSTGSGGGRWAGGTGRRRQITKAPTASPPPDGLGPVTRKKVEVIIGGGRRGGAGECKLSLPMRFGSRLGFWFGVGILILLGLDIGSLDNT
ncbi:hypothetical protein EV426DRAFT_213181 [Tirmania nivea]|nr:hypothetical protein EV426DRAFT_213181 [Tirmania nivea]